MSFYPSPPHDDSNSSPFQPSYHLPSKPHHSSSFHLPSPPSTSHGTQLMGRPIHFISGQFANRTIRAEIHEIQKADLGRKYARVDRRPLDPPPVVQLRLFETFYAGTEQEMEREINHYEEIDSIGLLCNVDLFPVPHDNEISPRLTRHGRNPTPSTQPSSHQPRTPPSQHSQHRSHSHSYMAPNASPYMYSVPVPASTAIPIIPPPIPQNAYNPTLTSSSYPPRHYTSCSQPPSPPDVVYQLGDLSVTESSKLTSNLVGNTFVQPCCIEYQGKKSLMFVFSDLAVKIEGTFILRYRMFDLFSKSQQTGSLPVQAECYGGMFRIYSTKEFPGLQASTELTKHLAVWGVRLNIRETERRRRKKEELSPSPPYAITGKRKYSSLGPNNGYNSEDD